MITYIYIYNMLSCMKGVEIIFGKRAQPCTQSRLLSELSPVHSHAFSQKLACFGAASLHVTLNKGNYHSYLGGTETGPSEQTAISAELKQSQANK
jgi:hypothetical protein